MRCEFCDEYDFFSKPVKRIDDDTYLDVSHEVSLIQTIRKDGIFLSSASYQPYKLNFCPVCGRKIPKGAN